MTFSKTGCNFVREGHRLVLSLVLSSAIKVLCEWPFPPRTNSKLSKKRKYIRGLRRHTLFDNCGVCAEWNVLFFPLLKPGMWGIVDVRIILLLSSGIKVYSYPIKVFSVNRMIVETAVFFLITAEQARRLKSLRWKITDGPSNPPCFHSPNVLILNPQRVMYDDLAGHTLSESNAALRTEVRHWLKPRWWGECVERMANQQNFQLIYIILIYFLLIGLTSGVMITG